MWDFLPWNIQNSGKNEEKGMHAMIPGRSNE